MADVLETRLYTYLPPGKGCGNWKTHVRWHDLPVLHTHTHIRTYTCTYVCIIIHMTVQMPLQNTCENVFAARLSGVAGLRWGGPHCYSAAGSSLSCTWCTGCQWGLAGLPWWATCIVWTDIIHRQANVHMYMYVCMYVCIILCVEVCM